jgi:hypothetical protein
LKQGLLALCTQDVAVESIDELSSLAAFECALLNVDEKKKEGLTSVFVEGDWEPAWPQKTYYLFGEIRHNRIQMTSAFAPGDYTFMKVREPNET